MRFMKHLCAALLGLALLPQARAEWVVVVHAGNTEAISQSQIGAIYLGKTKSFPGGGRAQALIADYGSAGLDEFLAAYLGKNTAQYRALWARLMFSGEAIAPKVMASSKDIADQVAEQRDAIGIVDASVLNPKLRVVGKL